MKHPDSGGMLAGTLEAEFSTTESKNNSANSCI
jgi:hypothetical protein